MHEFNANDTRISKNYTNGWRLRLATHYISVTPDKNSSTILIFPDPNVAILNRGPIQLHVLLKTFDYRPRLNANIRPTLFGAGRRKKESRHDT